MPRQEIQSKIYEAYRQLLLNDRYLFGVDASERSLTHKLAEYMQYQFTGWNVDCEYNRDGPEVKSVYPWEEKAEEILREIENEPEGRKRNVLLNKLENGLTVFPDIIVHHRGTNENLVIFEVKKSNYRGIDDDRQKLRVYISELEYKYAFKILLPIGEKHEELPDDFYTELVNTKPYFFLKYIEEINI